MSQATWTKLKSGEWGVRITDFAIAQRKSKGDVVSIKVTKKSGATSQEQVKIIWTDNKVALAVLADGASKPAPRNSAPKKSCRDCDRKVSPGYQLCRQCERSELTGLDW